MPKRKTQEQFAKIIGPDFIILNEYKNGTTEVELKHVLCGSIFRIQPINFKGKCEICKRKEIEDGYRKKFKEKYGDRYELLSEHLDFRSKVIIKDTMTGEIFHKDLKYCLNRKQNFFSENDQYKNDFISLIESEGYILKSEYIDCATRVNLFHIKCGTVSSFQPIGFKNYNMRCYCEKFPNRKFIPNDIIENINSSNEFEVLGKTFTSNNRIYVKHKKCGRKFYVSPDIIRCCKCGDEYITKPLTTDIVKDKLYSLYGKEYSLLSEYVNRRTKIKVIHNICETTYETFPDVILRGNRCRKCICKPRLTYKSSYKDKEYLGYLFKDYYGDMTEDEQPLFYVINIETGEESLKTIRQVTDEWLEKKGV